VLTYSVPPAVTAATGIDAMIHCLEAYTNKFSHPVVDMFAIKGVNLISKYLVTAYEKGDDVTAREMVALGSVYGGLCLGPVNTAAVHALSYPLGGEFHITHGVSNAVLLPPVFKFNMEASVKKHAEIAIAMGAEAGSNDLETSRNALYVLDNIYDKCSVPKKISELGVPRQAIPGLADSAMKVTRLLKNNPRPLTRQDAVDIYNQAY
jgi:alcohol dehydrogenase class IV